MLVQSSTLGAEESKQTPQDIVQAVEYVASGHTGSGSSTVHPTGSSEQAVAAQPQDLQPSIWNPAFLQMSLPASTGTTQTHLLLQ